MWQHCETLRGISRSTDASRIWLCGSLYEAMLSDVCACVFHGSVQMKWHPRIGVGQGCSEHRQGNVIAELHTADRTPSLFAFTSWYISHVKTIMGAWISKPVQNLQHTVCLIRISAAARFVHSCLLQYLGWLYAMVRCTQVFAALIKDPLQWAGVCWISGCLLGGAAWYYW